MAIRQKVTLAIGRLTATCGLVLLTTNSICPAGWRLPTGLTSSTCSNSDQSGCSDFNFLLVQYGIAVNYVGSSNATMSNNGYSYIQNNPIYTTRSGSFSGGNLNWQASGGRLWSGTTISGTNAYHLVYGSSDVYPAYDNSRQYGFPVRCIARNFNFLLVQYGIAVNYVESGNATWSDNGYSNIQNNPIYTILSGYFGDGSFGNQESRGYLWSGATYSGTNAYYLNYNSSDVYPANYYYSRQGGFPVRCIA